ncbi:MAG TPA: SDR family NAD(P)-dependent oxidoreductase, partial [Candidatus Poseidoniales archaeon]
MGLGPKPNELHILITGGAGFIGSNLADECISQGFKVTVLDNLLTGYKENISHLFNNPNFTFIEGDIRDYETCKQAMIGCTHVSHQAALGSVPRSIEDPLLSLNINIIGTANIFFAAKEMGIKRIVFASSSSVYGSDETLPKLEEKTGTLLSPYASSKRSTEMIQQAFVSCYDMEIIGFRYFNVFGPKQDPDGPYAAVIPKFVSLIMNGEIPEIYGDGEQSRDFTHISNVVSGNLLAL